jgi:hypothetical protein
MLENLQNTSLEEPSDCDIILTCVQETRKRVRLYDPLLQYAVYVLDRRQVFSFLFSLSFNQLLCFSFNGEMLLEKHSF